MWRSIEALITSLCSFRLFLVAHQSPQRLHGQNLRLAVAAKGLALDSSSCMQRCLNYKTALIASQYLPLPTNKKVTKKNPGGPRGHLLRAAVANEGYCIFLLAAKEELFLLVCAEANRPAQRDRSIEPPPRRRAPQLPC